MLYFPIIFSYPRDLTMHACSQTTCRIKSDVSSLSKHVIVIGLKHRRVFCVSSTNTTIIRPKFCRFSILLFHYCLVFTISYLCQIYIQYLMFQSRLGDLVEFSTSKPVNL